MLSCAGVYQDELVKANKQTTGEARKSNAGLSTKRECNDQFAGAARSLERILREAVQEWSPSERLRTD